MKEPIALLLSTIGIELDFNDFTIKGIPGFALTVFHGETSSSTIDKRDYMIRCAAKDIAKFEIKENMCLTCLDNSESYRFFFRVKRDPVIQLTGWASIYVNFEKMEAIL